VAVGRFPITGDKDNLQAVSGIIIGWNVAIPACSPGQILPLFCKHGIKSPDWKRSWLHFAKTSLPGRGIETIRALYGFRFPGVSRRHNMVSLAKEIRYTIPVRLMYIPADWLFSDIINEGVPEHFTGSYQPSRSGLQHDRADSA